MPKEFRRVARDLDVDVLQIVLACAPHSDVANGHFDSVPERLYCVARERGDWYNTSRNWTRDNGQVKNVR
jgi:hypothetical protein